MSVSAIQSPFFSMIGYNEEMGAILLFTAFFLMATASLGCAAVSTKNEFLVHLVSVELIFVVWVLGDERDDHFLVQRSGCVDFKE